MSAPLLLHAATRGGVWVVALHGELDLATARQLRDAVPAPSAGSGDEALVGAVIDLTECTFLDSTGARAIASVGAGLQRQGVVVAVASRPGTMTSDVLEMLGVRHLMAVEADRSAAQANVLGGGHHSGTER